MKNFPVIRSNCYSPHSFERMINSLSDKETKESFSIFHNNVRSLRGNFKKLEEQLFSDLDFNFDLIGISETKITNSNKTTVLWFQGITLNTFRHLWLPEVLGCIFLTH